MHFLPVLHAQLLLIFSAPVTRRIWQGLIQVDEVEDMGTITHAMLLGAAVLIVAQAILVLVAIVWYRRSERSSNAD